jgi:cell fate (sporulation/competence/biofilm development) regulator YlbF (YheA/YmcA/DUF963 family)
LGETNVTDCIELAARLGKAMADSPEAVALRAAREALNAEPELTRTLGEYQKQADKIARLEREQKPVEVEDKHKLQELNDDLVASDVFKKFTAAQVEYVDLMRKVNDAIRRELTETEE